MEHRCQESIGHAVAGHVDDSDPGRALAPFQVVDNCRLVPFDGAGDPGVKVETLLEIDVEDVVAADRPIER